MTPPPIVPTLVSHKRKPVESATDFRKEFVSELDKTTGFLTAYLDTNEEAEKENPLYLALRSCVRLLSFTRESFVPSEDPIEKEKRERSVVIEFLPESTKEKASQRVDEDFDTVRDILDAAAIEVRPETVFRMGQVKAPLQGRAAAPRLLKVVLPRASAQKTLLKSARAINDIAQYKTIRIRPSLSASERDAQWKLREEKRRLNENGGTWVIYAGKLMEKGAVASYKASTARSRPTTPMASLGQAFSFPANVRNSTN